MKRNYSSEIIFFHLTRFIDELFVILSMISKNYKRDDKLSFTISMLKMCPFFNHGGKLSSIVGFFGVYWILLTELSTAFVDMFFLDLCKEHVLQAKNQSNLAVVK